MINEKSIQAVSAASFSQKFAKPLYDSFCFSRIPETARELLTGKNKDLGLPSSCFLPSQDPYDAALLFFLDGFAWRFFERHMSHPFCRRFLENGMISKLTAQFPSTTAAQVTTIHTGLEVGETGIYEWFQYEPKVDRVIAPLLFSYAGDKVSEALLTSGVSTAEFFPFETIYQKMHEEGITSHLFQHADISSSPYSLRMGRGSHLTSYFTLKQGLQSVKELLSRAKDQKTYALFYFADIDSVGHRKGVDSKELEDVILSTLDLLEEFMVAASSLNTDKKVAIMVTADHGMAPVDPKKTFYLNKECPAISSFLKKNKKGDLITPAGSCRDFFLHIKEESLDEAFTYLTQALAGKAEVWKVSELISLGLFGSHISSRFLERVGNLAVLPYAGEAIWWYERHRFEQHFYGAHGGLTREELEIPFLFTSI